MLTPAERRRERRAEVRRRYTLEKARGRCAICGEDDPDTLDYHHRWPERKKDSVAALVARGTSWARIYREICDCQMLCSNCHRKHHALARISEANRGPEASGS